MFSARGKHLQIILINIIKKKKFTNAKMKILETFKYINIIKRENKVKEKIYTLAHKKDINILKRNRYGEIGRKYDPWPTYNIY